MFKYYFYYYFQFGRVASAKVAFENGKPVGGDINAIEGNIHEITQHEYYNVSLFDLKAKYEYQDTGENHG